MHDELADDEHWKEVFEREKVINESLVQTGVRNARSRSQKILSIRDTEEKLRKLERDKTLERLEKVRTVRIEPESNANEPEIVFDAPLKPNLTKILKPISLAYGIPLVDSLTKERITHKPKRKKIHVPKLNLKPILNPPSPQTSLSDPVNIDELVNTIL